VFGIEDVLDGQCIELEEAPEALDRVLVGEAVDVDPVDHTVLEHRQHLLDVLGGDERYFVMVVLDQRERSLGRGLVPDVDGRTGD